MSGFRFDNLKNENIPVGKEASVSGQTVAVPLELLSNGALYFGVATRNSGRREPKGETPAVSLFIAGIERICHVQ